MPDLHDSVKETIKKEVLVVLDNLQNWWWHFKQETGIDDELGMNQYPDTAVTELFAAPPAGIFIYPDTLTALSVSLYNSAIIMLCSALVAIEQSRTSSYTEMSPIPRYHSLIQSHSASVLMAAAYQNWRHPNCGDALRTGFPIHIVSWFGISEAHRQEAQRRLEDLGLPA